MASDFLISIVICSYNRSALLLDSIASLTKEKTPPSSFEIVVVDNNSSDNTETLIKDFISAHPKYNIRYIKETQQGLSFARNRGTEESKAPLVCFVDDDVIVSEYYVQKWIDFFDSHPEAIGAGGKIKVQFDDPRPEWMPDILLPLFAKHDLGDEIKKYTKGRYPIGANFVYRKHIFEKAGDFNTKLGRKGNQLEGGEEKDIFLRITQHNDNVFYVPEVYLWHRVGAQRLTQEYIKGQALGTGKSISVILIDKSFSTKLFKWSSEIFKFFAGLLLCLGYFLTGKISKGVMIMKFRFWVWKGYFSHRKSI